MSTKQRSISTADVPLDIVPQAVSLRHSTLPQAGDGGSEKPSQLVVIDWGDIGVLDGSEATEKGTHVSTFESGWLRMCCYSDQERKRRHVTRAQSRSSWDATAEHHKHMARYQDVMKSDEALWKALCYLWKHGLLLMDGLEPELAVEQTGNHMNQSKKENEK